MGRPKAETIEQRLFANRIITEPDNCWEWQLSINRGGYGMIAISNDLGINKKRLLTVHRASFAFFNNKTIPEIEPYVIAHLCDNRKCFNPEHLECVSQKENLADMLAKKRNRHRASKEYELNKHYAFQSLNFETMCFTNG